MKCIGTIFVLVLLSLCVMAQTPARPAPAAPSAPVHTPATAEPAVPEPSGPPPVKIGLIELENAVLATNEGLRESQALEKKFAPRSLELKNAKAELDRLEKQLETSKMTASAQTALARQIAKKRKALERNTEDAQSDWQNQRDQLIGRIAAKFGNVLEKYAIDNGYAVILDVGVDNSGVIWASQSTNVSKAVIDAYNAASKVPPPLAGKPAATPARRPKTAPFASKPAGATGTTRTKSH